jgi:hypothetical protein
MDWGMAEEAGFAVHWLEAHGLPGTKILAQYLSTVHRDTNFDYDNCPLKLGCIISDTGDWNALGNTATAEPLLLVPFIANVAGEDSVELVWAKNKLVIHNDGVTTDDVEVLDSNVGKSHHICNLKPSTETKNVLKPKNRVLDDAKSHVAILNALAHKTYAPATAASRLAGAGAGLNDND